MAWRPHSRAHADPSAPRAWGKCDRCQSIYALRDLRWQRDWGGSALINKRLKVCDRCRDKPQPQLKEKRIAVDGKPVKDPRPINNPLPEILSPFNSDFSDDFGAGPIAIDEPLP